MNEEAGLGEEMNEMRIVWEEGRREEDRRGYLEGMERSEEGEKRNGKEGREEEIRRV
jgi:hypothetical protein